MERFILVIVLTTLQCDVFVASGLNVP
jgi:hypothetical protein